ncbi:E3 ubiquitin/ISG15 ligase TRIM25-like [Oryzias melastigma]|uniref:E3 ubiquitin/ISG15 ligase TRIM25-like n=1 Tax=Oryzias melastigma TaxID=30732 RepID=UPI00168D5D32|nr:E3 ubiquitin/ISG15 ligase TRIM25-like [Oryzias melastigma]
MAQPGNQLNSTSFSCMICQRLLKDPVTITCRHSYCMTCIKSFWDKEEGKSIYSCPHCRHTYTIRPVLVKNSVLAELSEQFQKTGLQAAPADCSNTRPEDVSCDVCTDRKIRALKSCLICLASYCEEHLQPHYVAAPFKKHKLVEPSKNLQENISSTHNEGMKMFYHNDQNFFDFFHPVNEHTIYKTISATTERKNRERDFEKFQQQIQQRIQDREKEVKLLQQELEAIHHSADQTVKDSEEIFTQMIRLIQKRSCDVKQQIRSQQQTEVSRVKDLQEELEQDITELKRRDAELKQLAFTEDYSNFLLNYPSLPPLSESSHSSSINVRPLRYFEDVTAAVSELRDKLQDILREEWTNISRTLTHVDVLLPEPEPKRRADFLKYSCQITLDPNTAHTHLCVTEENRMVTVMSQQQSFFNNPDRFTGLLQVLSRESLTGRCYWEVEWRAEGIVMAVTYRNIGRAGNGEACRFGWNDKSWALYYHQNSYRFCHNSMSASISAPVSSRVGVYLDHRAGVLSFYSVSESMTLLHRVQTTFTQPLHAGLWLYKTSDTARLCKLK